MRTQDLMALVILGLVQPAMTFAADISDEVTADVEEMSADSEAAKQEAEKARVRVAEEQKENARELKNVRDARNAAAVNRVRATETLQVAEGQLKRLASEKAQLNSEIMKFNHESMVSEKMIGDSSAKLTKVKADIASLQAIKAEKLAKLTEINQQKMQLMREVGLADDQYAVTQRELERALAEEKNSIEELTKTRQEEVARKVQLDAKIKELKDQIQATRAQARTLESDVRKYKAHNRRLEGQIQAGQTELKTAGQ